MNDQEEDRDAPRRLGTTRRTGGRGVPRRATGSSPKTFRHRLVSPTSPTTPGPPRHYSRTLSDRGPPETRPVYLPDRRPPTLRSGPVTRSAPGGTRSAMVNVDGRQPGNDYVPHLFYDSPSTTQTARDRRTTGEDRTSPFRDREPHALRVTGEVSEEDPGLITGNVSVLIGGRAPTSGAVSPLRHHSVATTTGTVDPRDRRVSRPSTRTHRRRTVTDLGDTRPRRVVRSPSTGVKGVSGGSSSVGVPGTSPAPRLLPSVSGPVTIPTETPCPSTLVRTSGVDFLGVSLPLSFYPSSISVIGGRVERVSPRSPLTLRPPGSRGSSRDPDSSPTLISPTSTVSLPRHTSQSTRHCFLSQLYVCDPQPLFLLFSCRVRPQG